MSEQWYYTKNDEKHGPVTAERMKELAASGQLHPSDRIWKEGMKEWAKAGVVRGLFTEAPQSGPPPLPQKKIDEPPPLPSATTSSQPSQTIDQASLRQKYEGLRQSIVQHSLTQQDDLTNTETISSFRKEHSNLQEQLKQLQDRLQQLGKAKTEYEVLENTCQQKSKELASTEVSLGQFAQPLGKAAFEGFVSGQIQNQPILNERFSVHRRIAELHTEYDQLKPANDAGMIQKTKAKAQQLVVTGKIKLEEMKINKLEEQIGKQLIASTQEDSVKCDHTTEILSKVAKQRGIIATCKEAFNKAREVLDTKKQELCQSLKLTNIDGSKSFSTFQQQCLVQISQVEKQQNTLEKNLSDRLLADEAINDQGALGQLLRELRHTRKQLELAPPGNAEPTAGALTRPLQADLRSKWTYKKISVGILVACGILFIALAIRLKHEDPDVTLVRTGHLTEYPNITIGEAVDNFMASPHWESGTAKDGTAFVNVKGKVTLMDKEVEAVLQFEINHKTNTFEVRTLECNGIPQNRFMQLGFIAKMFEPYEK